jgi:hypothetical protein
MSWNSLLSIKNTKRGVGNRISVLQGTVRIRIDRRSLVAVGWVPGDHVNIMFGEEDDFGLIRIEKDDDGWMLTVPTKTDPEKARWVSVKVACATRQVGVSLPDRLSCVPINLEARNGGLEFTVPWMNEFRKAPVVDEKTIDPLEAIAEIIQDEKVAPEPASPLPPNAKKKLRGDFSDGNVRTRDNGRVHLLPPTLLSGGN